MGIPVAKVRTMAALGNTPAEIAQVLGVRADTISRLGRRNGIKFLRTAAIRIDERRARILKRYNAGETIDAIARAEKIKHCTVYKELRVLRPLRRVRQYTEADDARILAALDALASLLGRDTTAVASRIHDLIFIPWDKA